MSTPLRTPTTDPDVLRLYARVMALVESDDNWPGGDVVNVLSDWFERQGLDVRDGQRLRRSCPVCPEVFAGPLARNRLGEHLLYVHVPDNGEPGRPAVTGEPVEYQYGIQWPGSKKVEVCECGGVDHECEAMTRRHARSTGGEFRRRPLGAWEA